MTPLVSVMIPTFNAASSLPLAIASLLSQTYQHWECIVVDDGSSDETSELMKSIQAHEPRIRYIQLQQNFGRAIARQIALDNAQGKYLAMIDADDWVYPAKLEKQIGILESNPDIALVSTGMAIVSPEHSLMNVRLFSQVKGIQPPIKTPRLPPVAHAPSMIRMEIAKETGYNSRLQQTEDADFLLRILLKHSYFVIDEPLYAYYETNSLSKRILIKSHLNGLRIFSSFWFEFPIKTFCNISVTLGKIIIIQCLAILRLQRVFSVSRPKVLPTSKQKVSFFSAKEQVFFKVREIISGNNNRS